MRDFVDIVDFPERASQDLQSWTIVGPVDSIPFERGVAGLIEDVPVALFRLIGSDGDEWYAVSHNDPMTGAPVMARGLIGSFGKDFETPTVASPLHKRRYDLKTGACLDDDTPGLEVFEVLVADGLVLIR